MPRRRAAVLGAGLVGGLIARDLATDSDFQVRIADVSPEALERARGIPGVAILEADLSRADEVLRAVEGAGVVVLALPGSVATPVLRAVLDARRPVADISFAPEDPFELDAIARAAGVAAVVDCGVAPGLSNLLVGRSSAALDETESVSILVGGLPVRRVWPWEYRVVFSLSDVLEEYSRPCRMREHGVEVVKPALSEVELVELPEVGTLEAFNTDGLRTLLRTLPAPTLKEKTLRYPGHAERMRALRETGFFDTAPLSAGGREVAPRDVTLALLGRALRLPEGEEELTILRVEVEGRKGGKRVRLTWNLLDRTDRATGATSMSRTTGFPCAIVARLLARGQIRETGIVPPEILGRDERLTGVILDELARRGVRVRREETEIG